MSHTTPIAKTRPRFRAFAIGVSLLAISTGGCGSSGFSIAPVSGVVTLDGEPLANAHVGFEPVGSGEGNIAGPGSYGTTDSTGRYRLETLDEHDGAVVGKHRVAISTFRGKKGPKGEMIIVSKELLPAVYHAASTLSFEVPSDGTESADFDLKSD